MIEMGDVHCELLWNVFSNRRSSTTFSCVKKYGDHQGLKVAAFMERGWNLASRRLSVLYSLTKNYVSPMSIYFVENPLISTFSK